MRTGLIVFEGGATGLMTQVRHWVALDTLEKFRSRPEIDVTILATDHADLAREAAAGGTVVHPTGDGFHFGRHLLDLVTSQRLDRVAFLGGGAVPLLRPEEITRLFQLAPPGERVLVANNVQSPDVVAIASTDGLGVLADLRTDNAALFRLVDAGYERRLLPETATANFDLDTPSDILFLAYEAARGGSEPSLLGPRCHSGLGRLNLDLTGLERAAEVLAGDYRAVTLVGRVSGTSMNHLNASLKVRLRVFSEERGMKALGRLDRGEVRSLLGTVARERGVAQLVRILAELSEAVFWDTRVLLAHLGDWPDEEDRFLADLGRWTEVRDPDLRELTRAAGQAGVPFVLGGHSVVSGGLRLLVDRLARGVAGGQ